MAFPTTSLYARFIAESETYNDDDPVDTATDQSAQGNTPAASGSARPTYKTGIINSLAVYRCDGTDDRLFDAILASPIANATAFSIFAVLNSGAGEATSRVWPWELGDGTTNIFGFTEGVTSGEWGTFVRTSAGTIQQTTSGVDTTQNCVLTIIWDGVDVIFYRNGTQIDSDALGGNIDIEEMNIGGFLSQFFSGDVAEVAAWNKALDATERQDLHCYVQDTYNITVADSCPGADASLPPFPKRQQHLLIR